MAAPLNSHAVSTASSPPQQFVRATPSKVPASLNKDTLDRNGPLNQNNRSSTAEQNEKNNPLNQNRRLDNFTPSSDSKPAPAASRPNVYIPKNATRTEAKPEPMARPLAQQQNVDNMRTMTTRDSNITNKDKNAVVLMIPSKVAAEPAAAPPKESPKMATTLAKTGMGMLKTLTSTKKPESEKESLGETKRANLGRTGTPTSKAEYESKDSGIETKFDTPENMKMQQEIKNQAIKIDSKTEMTPMMMNKPAAESPSGRAFAIVEQNGKVFCLMGDKNDSSEKIRKPISFGHIMDLDDKPVPLSQFIQDLKDENYVQATKLGSNAEEPKQARVNKEQANAKWAADAPKTEGAPQEAKVGFRPEKQIHIEKRKAAWKMGEEEQVDHSKDTTVSQPIGERTMSAKEQKSLIDGALIGIKKRNPKYETKFISNRNNNNLFNRINSELKLNDIKIVYDSPDVNVSAIVYCKSKEGLDQYSVTCKKVEGKLIYQLTQEIAQVKNGALQIVPKKVISGDNLESLIENTFPNQPKAELSKEDQKANDKAAKKAKQLGGIDSIY